MMVAVIMVLLNLRRNTKGGGVIRSFVVAGERDGQAIEKPGDPE
jgi:hypothetical protein